MESQSTNVLLSSLLESLDQEGSNANGSRTSRDIRQRVARMILSSDCIYELDLQHIGITLEELMIMEAMRRSMNDENQVEESEAEIVMNDTNDTTDNMNNTNGDAAPAIENQEEVQDNVPISSSPI